MKNSYNFILIAFEIVYHYYYHLKLDTEYFPHHKKFPNVSFLIPLYPYSPKKLLSDLFY